MKKCETAGYKLKLDERSRQKKLVGKRLGGRKRGAVAVVGGLKMRVRRAQKGARMRVNLSIYVQA